ncbi:Sec-independent protein translocase subunit TatA [Actinotalea ferrariae]|uniref:Sec-independent protein translocase subunit TatA n=1 Tax=Actinotalea ferrariae TaxID=1386098 RepID=UPI001C8CC934|nr:Sec-independent protein translocase subunit TatA [Actinotalea ferrariae]MBX9245065.1 Sec-independent protein translocase subunit TatA [Actinotalea ferrariae]
MGNLRGWEWVILLAIVLLLFGARRLPDLARSVGRSMKIFRSEVKDMKQDESPSATGATGPSSAPMTPPPPGALRTPPVERATTDDDGERPRP